MPIPTSIAPKVMGPLAKNELRTESQTQSQKRSLGSHESLRADTPFLPHPEKIFNTQSVAHLSVRFESGDGPAEASRLHPFRKTSLYNRLSMIASQLASMTFTETPTVVQDSVPSVDSISTRTFAAVPSLASSTRTL